MKYFNKKIMLVALPLVILLAYSPIVMGGTNKVVIGSYATGTWHGPSQQSTSVYGWVQEVVGQLCGGMCWGFNPAYATMLNLNTGAYEIIGKAYLPERIYGNKCGYPSEFDIAHMKAYVGCGISTVAIDLSTGKVAGTFTENVSPSEEYLCQLEGRPSLIDPDGSRIAMSDIYDEKNCTQAIWIFDLNTFKLINTLYNVALGDFSSDGKFIYAYATPIENYLYIINPYNGKIISQFDLHSIDPTIYRGVKGVSGWWYVEDGKRIRIDLRTDDKKDIPFLYNPETKATTPTITTDWYWDDSEGKPGLPYLSPGSNWWIADNAQHNHIDIYEVSTGSKVAGFDISSPTGTGAIISWVDDHTFIYNTTQKLIYFDIKQNKIIKQLPIIRPWEQAGWKPVVGK